MDNAKTEIGSADKFIDDSLNEKRELILSNVRDLVGSLLYYDRKEDEDLGRGEIEAHIGFGVISGEDIVAEFSKELEKRLKDFAEFSKELEKRLKRD